jgi:5-(carboxyamino)imidazole ribonucleotide synthase
MKSSNQSEEASTESRAFGNPVRPGATIGIVGGGQLGRMLAIEAKKLGYTVGILDPDENAPASQVSDFSMVSDYSDPSAVRALADKCDVLTYEFENVAAGPLREQAAARTRLHPSPEVLHIAQNREREKTFLAMQGFPCARFEVVSSPEELAAAAEKVGFPCVLKTADFGYDGKGQRKLAEGFDPVATWIDFGGSRAVLEAWVPFEAELSVVCARWEDGTVRTFPVAENLHRNHILDVSIAPARFSGEIQTRAVELAASITAALDVVGLLAVEMFLTADGSLLVNELAPRPHNSGHFSFDACICSQFEQHIRAICGLPPGSTELLRPVVMSNLLGEVWRNDRAPEWELLLKNPALKLHLYGKAAAKPGRKMGHFCVLAGSVPDALDQTNRARAELGLPEIL